MTKIQTNNYSFVKDFFNNVPKLTDEIETKLYSEIYTNSLSLADQNKFKKQKIDYQSDRWNLNVFFNKINDQSYSLNFEGLNNEIKGIFKHYIYAKLKTNIKPSSLRTQLLYLKPIIKDLYKNTNTYLEWDTLKILKVIDNRNLSISSKRNTLWSCNFFFEFVKNHYSPSLNIDCNIFYINSKKCKKIILTNPNKIPNIPDEYYNEIISTCSNIMEDKNICLNDRSIAAAIVMLAYTGLRISDLLGVEITGLKCLKCQVFNKTGYILEYFSRKPTKTNKTPYKPYTGMFPEAKKAFDILSDINKQRKDPTNTFLFTYSDEKRQLSYPIQKYYFRKRYIEFFYKYIPSCFKDWNGIKKVLVNQKTKELISVPDTRQFRVHIATALYEQGVDLKLIQKWLGHLANTMEGYYVRPKINPFDRIALAEKFLEDVVEKDLTPLGKNGEVIKERLKKFIIDNKFNIHSDIEDILTKLGDSFVIRSKTGGFCVRTTLIPCSKDERTNKILCSYNYCPNLYQFYYMIDITYQDFKNSLVSYETNLKNNHTLEAERECMKIKWICKVKLIPELKQLNQQIEKYGLNQIKEQHKNLNWIIDHKEQILKEVQLWNNKN